MQVRLTADGVGLVVVRLNVSVPHGLVKARDDGLNLERGVVREGIGKDVTSGHVDALLEEIVLENDETVVNRRRVAHDAFPVVEHLGRGRETAGNIKVWNMN